MKQKSISFLVMLLFFGVVATQGQNNQEWLNAQFLILDNVQPLTQAERARMEDIFHAEHAV